ncbi:MAG: ExeA family protein, partial [Caldimonas sp.]
MYLAHFGLRELPFGLTPDPAYAFSARAHQEALNTLLVATGGGEGFIKITGEVGTGKTLLCRRFLAVLAAGGDGAAGTVSCYLPNPNLTPRTLLLSLAEELGDALPAAATAHVAQKRIEQRLVELAAAGRRVVVCLDEAQALAPANLEALRLLSNLETEKKKLLQIVLFGQPELDRTLERDDMRQLRQRIAFQYRLDGLTRAETGCYVDHRMRVAGHAGATLFAPRAIDRLQRASGGTPRLVNILAHKSLLAAFGDGAAAVDARHVRAAVRDGGAAATAP